jgi:hypothetical protein
MAMRAVDPWPAEPVSAAEEGIKKRSVQKRALYRGNSMSSARTRTLECAGLLRALYPGKPSQVCESAPLMDREPFMVGFQPS